MHSVPHGLHLPAVANRPGARRQPRVPRFARPLSMVALVCLLAGCASPGAVSLTGAWPEAPRAYTDAYRDWTRHGILRQDYQEVLDVHATFKSPEWRAAYVERTARRLDLTPEARQRLLEAQAEAAHDTYEVHLLVTTYHRRENDLNRGERSIWRLALRDDRGNEVEPISIVRDRRPDDVVRAEFPDLGDFAVPYVARFPRTIEVLRPDATRFSLLMASPRGAVELVWRALAPRAEDLGCVGSRMSSSRSCDARPGPAGRRPGSPRARR